MVARSPRSSPARRGAALAAALALVALVVPFAPRSAEAAPLSLANVVERARASGPVAQTSRAEVRVASETRAAAPLPPLLNPTLEILVDRGKYTKDVQVVAQLYLPVEMSGQRSARIEEADALVGWRKADQRRALAIAVGEAVAAYGEVLVAEQRVRDATEGEKNARDEAAYYRGRFDARDATSVDVALADGELARWKQARAEAELGVARARTRLEAALGGPFELAGEAQPEVPALRYAEETVMLAKVAKDSPFLEAPGLEARFWSASRERLEADKTPPVSIVLLGGRGDLGEARYGAGVAWAFPVARKNQVEIARADAERDRALVSQSVASRTLETHARGQFRALELARQSLKTHDEVAIPAAKAVVDASVAAVKAGKIDVSRVFLARRDLAAARSRRLDALANAWTAYAGLTQLIGDLP
jgi:cobalt-zinc-cadmium efflux system outer membrane protein